MSETTDYSALLVLLTTLGILTLVVLLIGILFKKTLCNKRLSPSFRSIFITGCDSGIGHELALYCDALGFKVFAGCYNSSSEGAQRLRNEASSSLHLVNIDVTQEDHVRHALSYISENLPLGINGLHALINNAGICVCGEFEWQTMKQIEEQINVNLLGSIRTTKYCLPLLKAGAGRVINVSSVAGLYGYPGLATYCGTKHALEGLSVVLREELSKFNIRVITVQPGDFSKATHLLDNHHKNMNEMWSEMSETSREEYKDYFIRYHDGVSKTGLLRKKTSKPLSVLPSSIMTGFEKALLHETPENSYLLLPTFVSGLKMKVLSLLPRSLSQSLICKRYRQTLPNLRTRSPELLKKSIHSSSFSSLHSTSSASSASSASSLSF